VLYEDVVQHHVCPVEIITDRGSEFTNSVMKGLTDILTIKKRLTTAYNARVTGQAERTNKPVVDVMKKLVEEYKTTCFQILKDVIFAYNTSPSRITGETKFFVKYGVEAILSIEIL
jgi:hypothetical protein